MSTPSTLFLFGPNGNLGPIWSEAAKESGWSVVGLGLASAVSEVAEPGFEFHSFDLINFDEVKLVELLTKFEPNTVIFNSGIDSPPGTGCSKIQEFELNSWQKIFEVNLFGFINVMNVILKHKLKVSNVIVVGSMYATLSPNFHLYSHFNGNKGLLKHPAYGASKSALKSVVEQYAATLAHQEIRVNMISPGGVLGNQDSEFIKKFSDRTPLARLAAADELKPAMKFLLDPSNTYLTGQNLEINGGYNLW
jgi:NAD(P)-dependent dehydrogenase (short-subunit alcohol dehydrogenase family)